MTVVAARNGAAKRSRFVPAREHGREVSNGTLAFYALPSIPIASLAVPVAVLMPAYYASGLHVSLSQVGLFLLLSRCFDVVLDPMIGKWSDGTNSRFGRRKIWMIGGTPLLMIGAYLLFLPPAGATGWYLLVASFAIYAGGSAVGLPYSAWGTELAQTYHGRARMAGFREAAGVIGSLLAASVPAVTAYFGHGVDRFTMSIVGFLLIFLTPLTVAIAVTRVPEPPVRERAKIRWLRAIPELARNGPFRILCASYVLFNIGATVVNSTIVFYISDYLGEPTIVGPSLLTAAATTILSVPLWLKISRRVGKHRAISYSLFLTMAIFALAVPMLHRGQGTMFIAIMAILGIVSSGYVTLPISIIGDVIDFDTLRHCSARGGLFWGVWSFAQKVTPAIGIAIALPVLKWLGFDPGAHNGAHALAVLRDMFCFGGIPFLVAGAVCLLWFPIDARRHDIIRRRLEGRETKRCAWPSVVGGERSQWRPK